MSYTPTRDDIKNLGANDAEKFLQGILWSCADRIGAGKNVVGRIVQSTVSRRPAENVKDGGLELTISLPGTVILQPPFTKHRMIVQVKSGEPLTKTSIERELDKEKVKEFLKDGGHYILAYTGFVPTYGDHDKGTWGKEQLDALQVAIEKSLGKDTTVTGEVWHADDVERLAKGTPQAWDVFPAVNLFRTLCSRTLESLINAKFFSKSGFDIPFALGDERESALNSVTTWLSSFGGYFELRGNMGIGKSRLIYEAVKKINREATTVWLPSRPEDPAFIANCHAFLSANPNSTLRLVIDECDDDIADQLRNMAQMFPARVSLLGIFPIRSRDVTKKKGSDFRHLPNMSKNDMKTVLKEFQLREEVENWIIQICDGYPKLARVLAESAKKETDKLTRETLISWLADHEVFRDETRKDRGWVNLILTPEDQEVLSALALLTEVGVDGHRRKEYQNICKFFAIEDDAVEKSIVKNLDKGLLTKGSDYVYVTPLILASYLCAFKIGGMREEKIKAFSEMLQSFPRPQFGKSAIESFTERIKMSSLEEGAQKKLQSVLGHLSPFDKAVLQSEVVAELAFACCHFQPQSFLNPFVNDLRTRSPEEVKTWVVGRRRVVRFLEAAAFYPELFDQAVEGLFLLAKAEIESFANNAAGIWADFFHPGLSGSMAPLPQRARWLIKLVESGDNSIDLIDAAVKSMVSEAGSRMAGHENQLGLPYIEVDHRFLIGEYYEALNQLIEAIKKHSARLPNLVKILIENLRNLVRYGYIQKHLDVVSWLEEASKNDLELRQRLLISSQHIVKWESRRLSADAKKFFNELCGKLDSGSFEDTVRRWTFDPLLDDYQLAKEENNAVKKLALEIIQNPKKLGEIKDILTHPKATRPWYLMFKLGEHDDKQELWNELSKWSDPSQSRLVLRYLIGRSYGKADPDWIDDRLDEMNTASADTFYLAEASKDVETDRSFSRLLNIGKSKPEHIGLLVYGGRAARMNPTELSSVVDVFRLSKTHLDPSSLWDVLGQYVHGANGPLPISKEQIEFLLHSLSAPGKGGMTDHYQDEVLKVLLDHHIDEQTASTLADTCISVIADEKSEYQWSRRCGEVLKSIAEKWPEPVFKAIFEHMKDDNDFKTYKIETILDDWAHGVFRNRLEEEAQKCDEHTGELIARLLPDSYAALNNTSAVLLQRFPSNGSIASAIIRAFISGTFWGPLTDRLAKQIEALESWAAQHGLQSNSSITSLKTSLAKQLEENKRAEEEEDFLRKKDR